MSDDWTFHTPDPLGPLPPAPKAVTVDLLKDCHHVLLDVAVALGEAYSSDKPMHPAAHRVLAEKVASVLARFNEPA